LALKVLLWLQTKLCKTFHASVRARKLLVPLTPYLVMPCGVGIAA
jgi:hypothetical protein